MTEEETIKNDYFSLRKCVSNIFNDLNALEEYQNKQKREKVANK